MNHRIRSIIVAAIAAACSFGMSGGSSMAGIMYFENPAPGEEGHFNWHVNLADDPVTFEQWLDITRPSTDQFGLASGNSVGQLFEDNQGDSANITDGGAQVARFENPGLTRALQAGDIIGPDLSVFDDLALHVFSQGSGLESEFPEGELRYIGVLTEEGNYGWIAVMRVDNEFGLPFTLRAFAWAYETEPGVPIRAGEVPAVGGVALFGLMGLTSRRRRAR